MPQNTQMHVQWITVNGQSVPLVLPQYWDGEKWVISSEQNPLPVKAELTEIEDGKLNVRDVDVKAELELVKQQQQQILDRLNQPMQTELTGKNIEVIADVASIEVPAGVIGSAVQDLDISRYKYLFIQFMTGGADKYTVQMRPNRGDEMVAFTSTNLLENESGTGNRIIGKVEVNCLSASFFIINEMESDHTFYKMIILGVRQ